MKPLKTLLVVSLFLPGIALAQSSPTLAQSSPTLAQSSPTLAQAWPAKPVRLIVPFAPGGATDVIARLAGQKLGDALGQQFLVDNRPGANGNIGTEMAVKAPADGYTLVMSYDGTMAINPSVYRKMPFDPMKDLAPVASVAQLPLLMVVNPGVAAKNVAEFVALAKASPGKINYSGAGYPVVSYSWYGILAPAGTPPDIVRKLNAEINRILQAPDVRERLTALGTEPTGGTPEQFAETIKADTAKWAKVVSDSGIHID